jgi:predicted RNA binding protein YcfA (HicA-like mRNA interferase family)
MPGEQRFAAVRKILESKGYRLDRISGSHHVFSKSGQQNVVIVVHGGKVMPCYVREAQKAQ